MTIDWWAVTGWLMTAGGFVLAVWALVVADGAKKAVAAVLVKKDEQVVRDDSRELLTRLHAARDAALARRGSAGRTAISGRSAPKDLEAIKLAQDALATTIISTDARLEQSLRLAGNQLDAALKTIEGQTDHDGWIEALGVLQGVIPKVNTHQRKLGTSALT